MALSQLLAIALLTLRAASVFAQAKPDAGADSNDELPPAAPALAVKVSTSFPQSEIFGVKLVNGHPTQALLSFANDDAMPVSVAFIGGSLWAPDPKTNGATSMIVRNLTSTRFNVQIPPGSKESISYEFSTMMHPQDLRLHLVAILNSEAGSIHTVNAFNETVSVVEPDASFFDPQLIFLYLMLLGLFAGSCYFIYNTWIATLFPQLAKGGDRGKRVSKKVDPSGQVSVIGGDGPATSTGSKTYDESWIPEHHINRPEAKRVKSGGGAGRPKSRGKPE